MKLAAYLRASTDLQQDSVAVQLQRIQEYCMMHNHSLVARYTDSSVSGGLPLAKRPACREMFRDAKDGMFEGIIALKLARLGRNAIDSLSFPEMCKKCKVELLFVQESYVDTPSGRFSYGIMALAAAFEREETGQRIKDHAKYAAQQGRWVNGNAPYGYAYDKSIKKLVPHPVYSKYLSHIYEIFVETGSRCQTARILNKENIPSPNDVRWCHSKVNHALTNRIYIGYQRYDGIYYPYEIERIISEEVFNKAQIILELTKKRHHKSTVKHTYIYNNVLFCAECGNPYWVRTYKEGSANYQCSSLRLGSICNSKMINDVRLNEIMPGLMQNMLNNYIDGLDVEDRPKHKVDKKAKYEKQRDRLLDLYVQGLIDDRNFKERLSEIDLLLSEVVSEVKPKVLNIDLQYIKSLALNLKDDWEGYTNEEKKEIVTLLIRRIDIKNNGRYKDISLVIHSQLLDSELEINTKSKVH